MKTQLSMGETRRPGLLAPLLLVLSGCHASEPPKAMVETQTNEQGCVRVRSTGPQDPAAIPVPIKQACVGPYLLELPQNYFYNQMGTESDGSFALALEYPSLEPFKPGERSNLSVDMVTRTVVVTYDFISGISAYQAMRNFHTPPESSKADPRNSFDSRIQGTQIYKLTPYYADMPRIRDYMRALGMANDAPGAQARWNTDWFVRRGTSGEVETLITCTSREIVESGVAYVDGKMVKKKGSPAPECTHHFLFPEFNTMATVRYVRSGLADWEPIETRVRMLFKQSFRETAQVRSDNRGRQK